jgi:EmrB/QacA subfamily drug resistance transporter
MTVAEPPDPAQTAGRNPWFAMAVVMAGMLMLSLDATMVTVALHPIAVDLGAGTGVEWVVSIYLLALAASQPITGWLSDRFGRKAMFLLALTVFTAASLACAAAPNLGLLVFFRAVQGFGGGALMPLGMAVALDLFPRHRHGFVIAMWGMAALVGPALGPTLGGWLATSVSWHWLFLINGPVGVVALILGFSLIPNIGHRERRTFDLGGLLLGSGGLSVLILGLAQGNQWGWKSVATLLCLSLGMGALVGFVRHEMRTTHPMIDLRMFRDGAFRLSSGAMLCVLIAQYGRLVFIPLELESVRGLSPLRVGLLFLPAAVAQGTGMHAGGRVVDRIGARIPMIIGAAMLLVAVTGYASLRLTTPIAIVVVCLSVQGFGCGLMSAPATVAGLSDLPRNLLAQGTVVRSLTGQVGGALSIGVLGAVIAIAMGSHPSPSQTQDAYNAGFAAAGVAVLFALVFSFRMPKVLRSSAPAGASAASGPKNPVDATEAVSFVPVE